MSEDELQLVEVNFYFFLLFDLVVFAGIGSGSMSLS